MTCGSFWEYITNSLSIGSTYNERNKQFSHKERGKKCWNFIWNNSLSSLKRYVFRLMSYPTVFNLLLSFQLHPEFIIDNIHWKCERHDLYHESHLLLIVWFSIVSRPLFLSGRSQRHWQKWVMKWWHPMMLGDLFATMCTIIPCASQSRMESNHYLYMCPSSLL